MAQVSVQVDGSKALVALGRFRLSLQENEGLMRQIGMAMLISIRRTFREQGSPAGSWVPLAPSTIRRDPKKYGPGHKLLIDKGALLNSITFRALTGSVVIGTSLKYAAVHQFGSRDRGGVAIGPAMKTAFDQTASVPARTRYTMQQDLGSGFMRGKMKRRIQGPLNRRAINVIGHTRRQHIPPRPYLVFRPEDPMRIRGIVVRYLNERAQQAGLGTGGAQ